MPIMVQIFGKDEHPVIVLFSRNLWLNDGGKKINEIHKIFEIGMKEMKETKSIHILFFYF